MNFYGIINFKIQQLYSDASNNQSNPALDYYFTQFFLH